MRRRIAARRGHHVRGERQFGNVESLIPQRAAEQVLRLPRLTLEAHAGDADAAIQDGPHAIGLEAAEGQRDLLGHVRAFALLSILSIAMPQAVELRHNTLPISRKNVTQRFAQTRTGCL